MIFIMFPASLSLALTSHVHFSRVICAALRPASTAHVLRTLSRLLQTRCLELAARIGPLWNFETCLSKYEGHVAEARACSSMVLHNVLAERAQAHMCKGKLRSLQEPASIYNSGEDAAAVLHEFGPRVPDMP